MLFFFGWGKVPTKVEMLRTCESQNVTLIPLASRLRWASVKGHWQSAFLGVWVTEREPEKVAVVVFVVVASFPSEQAPKAPIWGLHCPRLHPTLGPPHNLSGTSLI